MTKSIKTFLQTVKQIIIIYILQIIKNIQVFLVGGRGVAILATATCQSYNVAGAKKRVSVRTHRLWLPYFPITGMWVFGQNRQWTHRGELTEVQCP